MFVLRSLLLLGALGHERRPNAALAFHLLAVAAWEENSQTYQRAGKMYQRCLQRSILVLRLSLVATVSITAIN